MKKVLLVVMFLLLVGVAFAGGVSEQYVRDEYGKAGGFPNRDAWLYEFNSIANELIKDSAKILEGKASIYKDSFDNNCVRYQVLLDIGVELKYITDAVRKQQISKAETERKKVARYLASQSSGLGLE